jgi:hypothetical protein
MTNIIDDLEAKKQKRVDDLAWELIDLCAATLTNVCETTSHKVRICLFNKCHVCKDETYLYCADCRMNFGAYVYVCAKPECRDIHEKKCYGDRSMTEDVVRVLRIIEYRGPRKWVESTVAKSIQGTRECGKGQTITAATIGNYPEILEAARETLDNIVTKDGESHF